MSGHWAMVPDTLIRSGLSDRAVRVYALLVRYANGDRRAWPRQTVLAQKLDCSRATVERAVRELREEGWVTTERREAGGVLEYELHTAPVPPEKRSVPCVPPLTDEGRVPSRMRAPIEREPENETLPTATPPRAAVRDRHQAQESAQREAALDPERALGIWDEPAPPRRRTVNGDSPMGLALAWRETMREAGIGALDANVKALAAHFKTMLEQHVTPSQIRAITRLYAAKPGLRNTAASPWRDFLYQRHLLLAQVCDTDRYEAARTDAAGAYGLRTNCDPAAGARYSEDLARFLARR